MKSIKRAWATAALKAHGYTPQWTKGNKLAVGSRAALDVIDLHFHDLRHEGGSRLLDAGWPLHHVQHMLGHENLSQTSTCLNATKMGLRESMQRFDDSAPVAIRLQSRPTSSLRFIATSSRQNGRRNIYTRRYSQCAPVAQLDRAPAF